MSEEVILALIAALGGGGLTAFITALFNRRKTTADATRIITDAAHEILGDYRQRNNELDKELYDLRKSFRELSDDLEKTQSELTERDRRYRQEQALQDTAIENMNAKILKLELLNIIYVSQIRSLGVEPLIDPADINAISVDDLRNITHSLSNIEKRRSQKDVGTITRHLGGHDD